MAGTTKLLTAGGGGVNLTPASSIASDVTVNVPSQNCTLDIQGPAFSAYQSTLQTVTSGVSTKVQLQSEVFDTNSNFDTTNYRFTPTVAGYYQFNGAVQCLNTTGITVCYIWKNGSSFANGNFCTATAATTSSSVSSIVYMNGTTDYVEMYCFQNNGSTANTTNASTATYFNGALVRAA